MIDTQQDGSGLIYRRNRYYEPVTGTFNQADPIGLAGGQSSYGFAGGDPISFVEPFGLDGAAGQYAQSQNANSPAPQDSDQSAASKAKADSAQTQCYENYKLLSTVGAITGSEKAERATSLLETGSAISASLDVVAMVAKSYRACVGGGGNAAASGLRMVAKQVAKKMGASVATQKAIRTVTDKVSPVLRVVAAFSGAYNTTTELECRIGILK